MSCKSGPSVTYAETEARSSRLKSATASGHTKGNHHLNALLGQRQSSSTEYAACCWLLLAFRPASQSPMKGWPSTCTDVVFPCNRSRGPSCSDVPASMSPCSTPEHEPRSGACNTSPTSSRKSTTRRFQKATGSHSDRRWCGWNNNGSKEIKQELDAETSGAAPAAPHHQGNG